MTQRVSKSSPCRVCGGYEDQPRGKGVRCWGFLSGDGTYAHCTSEAHAGDLVLGSDNAYAHRLGGSCKCGVTHGEAIAGAVRGPDPTKPWWRPISPVPADAPMPTFARRWHGEKTAVWEIRGQAGELLGYTVRYEKPAEGGGVDKVVIPWTWCEDTNPATAKRAEWRRQGLASPRPLYGLPDLAAKPGAIVLLVEGEKTRDAAAILFPDLVVLSCLNGDSGPRNTDFAPLVGRAVVGWPDNDDAGVRWAAALAAGLRLAGAASIRIVNLPGGLPDKWDLADPFPPELDLAQVRRLIDEAPAVDWSISGDPAGDETAIGESTGSRRRSPKGFTVDEHGVWRHGETTLKVCGPLHIKAVTRDMNGENHGRLLGWSDVDGRDREWAVPMRLLAGDAAAVRERLMDGGLYVNLSNGARAALVEYLQKTVPERRLCADRVGWHGDTFVLPRHAIGPESGSVILQSEGEPPPMQAAGDLAGWQASIGQWCVGNSRLGFAVSAAFAAPLLRLVGDDSGGFHFRGGSSTGKTTILESAGSVWGGGGRSGYLNRWRATGNGLETLAVTYSDCLLTLDELAQLDSREAGDAAYTLANGAGKSRANRNGGSRKQASWRLLFLSAGEISLSDHMRQAGKIARGGHEVRFAEIPADVEAGLGAWEDLHGHPSAGAFSDALKAAVREQYGTPIIAFLTALAERHADWPLLVEAFRSCRSRFEAHVPEGAGGEVRRVAARFALVAAAGALATSFGVLPWPDDEAERASLACFMAWIDQRGTIGATDPDTAVRQVIQFLQAHGAARFSAIAEDEQVGPAKVDRLRDLAGFREWDSETETWRYLVFAEVFRSEACAGFDCRMVARALDEAGYLTRSNEGGRLMTRRVLPGMGRQAVYVLSVHAQDQSEDCADGL